MVDFSQLRKLDITGSTVVEYRFPDIPGEPSIMVAPATDANEVFLNERIRFNAERAAKQAKMPPRKDVIGTESTNPQVTIDQIEASREADRVLLSRCCGKAWGTPPVDVNGDTPEFNEANCYDFFKALPNWLFDPLRQFVQNIYNFVPRVTSLDPDDADAVGNS